MSVSLIANPQVDRLREFEPERLGGLTSEGFERARDYLCALPEYAPTPLLRLDAAAKQGLIAGLWYKDEGLRFNLGSFKALAALYGLCSTLSLEGLRRPLPKLQGENPHQESIRRMSSVPMTVCCASDGNYGYALSWAARRFGCEAVVFVPDACSEARQSSIGEEGARVIRIPGTYEDAHKEAIRCSLENQWVLVSDTAFDGYEHIPQKIMEAYQLVMHEVTDQISQEGPLTHILVQAGTGGFAAAVCSFLWQRQGSFRPCLIVVESDCAACLFRSAEEGNPIRVEGPHSTGMAGLACGEASTLAWKILSSGADFFASISDFDAQRAFRIYAEDEMGKSRIPSLSGIAGLAAFYAIASVPELRSKVGMDSGSTILVFATESLGV